MLTTDVISVAAGGTPPSKDLGEESEQARLFRAQISKDRGLATKQDGGGGSAEPAGLRVFAADVRSLSQELQNKLSIAHRWALPIVYGVLGSIVYCV